jgi:hypothetical protein
MIKLAILPWSCLAAAYNVSAIAQPKQIETRNLAGSNKAAIFCIYLVEWQSSYGVQALR